MSTERELHPTFDPLEPIHNPVTQTPAPATEQPLALYAFPDGSTRDEQIDLLLHKVAKDSTSNEARYMALTLLAGDKAAGTVDITKYHDEPRVEAPKGEPIPHAEIEPEVIAPVPAVEPGTDAPVHA